MLPLRPGGAERKGNSMKKLTSREITLIVIALRDHIKTLKEIQDNSERLKDIKINSSKKNFHHDWTKEIAEYEALINKLNE